ncbi:MAG: HAD-IA family hydrolase [Planctomycetota bacterium]
MGNVLLRFDPMRGCRNLARQAVSASDDSRIESLTSEIHRAVWLSDLQQNYETGLIDDSQMAAALRDAIPPTGHLTDQNILDALSDMFMPIDAILPILRQVQSVGVSIGLLSNTCAAHWDWIGRQNYPMLAQPWQAIILSHVVGAMKPAEKIYAAAQEACGCAPGEILFVDDREENILAAQRSGWQANVVFGAYGWPGDLFR